MRLVPYWAECSGRDRLEAAQLTARGGRLDIRVGGERVYLTGRAVMCMTGEITIVRERSGTAEHMGPRRMT